MISVTAITGEVDNLMQEVTSSTVKTSIDFTTTSVCFFVIAVARDNYFVAFDLFCDQARMCQVALC